MGHEDQFRLPTLIARCRFSQGTFGGTQGNQRDAPGAEVLHARMMSEKGYFAGNRRLTRSFPTMVTPVNPPDSAALR